ncbi:hypothetical protein ARMGADRAFT_1084525 [Armillaria gallica]|uniref:Uncharacterized protein n=1 Tax=Armillaria gallica TaxID=47427 RepID=A0A2H3DJX9_ARMGA|nr:hypothetical protein ARMGADRAFT_1084525 [Armillaria gallica]
MPVTHENQVQAISTRFARKTVPTDGMEDSKPNPQDFCMVQSDETLFELEEIGDCIAQIEVNGKEIREFQFVWLAADSMYNILGDSDHPAAKRVSNTFDILKDAFRTDFTNLHYLKPSQYKVFKQLMMTVEDLLSKVELADTIKGDCVFRLDQRKYSKVMSILRKRCTEAQTSLEANGIPNLRLPHWGTDNDVTEWITLSDLELFAIRFRMEVEHCLSIMLEYHDWETGQPRDQHDEDDDQFLPTTKCTL